MLKRFITLMSVLLASAGLMACGEMDIVDDCNNEQCDEMCLFPDAEAPELGMHVREFVLQLLADDPGNADPEQVEILRIRAIEDEFSDSELCPRWEVRFLYNGTIRHACTQQGTTELIQCLG